MKTAKKSTPGAHGRFVTRHNPAGRFMAARGHDKGLVGLHVHTQGSMKMQTKLSPAKVVETVREGLPLRELERLRGALGLPIEQVAAKVGMSKATFHRRKLQGKLTPDESDKVLRFARLMSQAVSIFGSEDNARQWLSAPQRGLGGSVPLDYAETEVGAREVENLLGRIAYGVYS